MIKYRRFLMYFVFAFNTQINLSYAQDNQGEERVATLQIENRANLPKSDVQYLSDLVQQAALRLPTERFSVMTNDNIQVMLPPGTRLEDCIDECAVQTARNLQAHWLVTGIVTKFGKKFKVVLKLYETKTGQPRESVMVDADQINDLEGPLQGAALRLFGKIESSMLEIADRLTKGFVFKKFQVASLPTFKTGVQLQGMNTDSVTGVDFGSVDVTVLERYELASDADKDGSSVSVSKRILLWNALRDVTGDIGDLARKRLSELETFERNRIETLTQLKEMLNADILLERERRAQMDKDWEKLSRLLPLKVVSKEDKIRWLEAFLESYGAIEELNPYVRNRMIQSGQRLIQEKFNRLIIVGQRELDAKNKRLEEIKNRICTIDPYENGCEEWVKNTQRRQDEIKIQELKRRKSNTTPPLRRDSFNTRDRINALKEEDKTDASVTFGVGTDFMYPFDFNSYGDSIKKVIEGGFLLKTEIGYFVDGYEIGVHADYGFLMINPIDEIIESNQSANVFNIGFHFYTYSELRESWFGSTFDFQSINYQINPIDPSYKDIEIINDRFKIGFQFGKNITKLGSIDLGIVSSLNYSRSLDYSVKTSEYESDVETSKNDGFFELTLGIKFK